MLAKAYLPSRYLHEPLARVQWPVLNARQNHLLCALPAVEFARLDADLELVYVRVGEVIPDEGGLMRHVYFPINAILSLHYVMENGASVEVAGVGNEGVHGVSVFMGGESMSSRALVQTAGHCYRLKSTLLLEEFKRGGPLLRVLLRYSQALITQIAQTGACNRHHTVEQQLCRWLLLTLDRLSSNDLVITQEMIANMLGVRRESVTEAAMKLKQRGFIDYRRGHITVVDRPGLHANVCECYEVVKSEFNRLLHFERRH
jgi:CRP-like cAMP-binding protein